MRGKKKGFQVEGHVLSLKNFLLQNLWKEKKCRENVYLGHVSHSVYFSNLIKKFSSTKNGSLTFEIFTLISSLLDVDSTSSRLIV